MNNLGKTTMVNGLIEFLNKKNKNAVYLKYPIYNLEPTGPRINKYLREGNPEKLTPRTVQEIYVRNRKDFEPELKRMLDDGKVIISEDYVGTGIAWGMIGGASLEEIEKLNEGLMESDLAILLDGERFIDGVEKGHAHESLGEKWDKGRQIHLDLAMRYNWKTANANQTREKVLEEVIEILKREGIINL